MIAQSTARHIAASLLVVMVTASATTVWLWACGPEFFDIPLVANLVPARLDNYSNGDIGVVRPRFARRYLVQAYRVLTGQPPLTNIEDGAVNFEGFERPTPPVPATPRPIIRKSPSQEWLAISKRRFGFTANYFDTNRGVGTSYAFIENCLEGAFATALQTLEARMATFGSESREVEWWGRAQNAVFANCGGKDLVLPSAPPSPHPLVQADHEYQTAAAYFYATQYEEAVDRFSKIAANESSPWQPYGRYLAARATIRRATVREVDDAQRQVLLAEAEKELRSVLNDTRVSMLHASARGLLDFIAIRMRPEQRRRELAQMLRTSPIATERQIYDYKHLLDKLVGDTVDYEFNVALATDPATSDDELSDWILTTQANGEAARTRAVARWQSTQSSAWLVSVLWKLPAGHPEAARALAAAARIDRASAAFPTVSFLRARLLIARGEIAVARDVLATLPTQPEAGFDVEAINLIRALRFRVAANFEEFIANAPRTSMVPISRDGRVTDTAYETGLFDDDAGRVFTDRFPVTRLIDAARVTALPSRLRSRLAGAALARAIVLRQHAQGRAAARLLRDLDRSIRGNLDAYLGATTPDDRHRAGLLLLLRTPALHAYVRGGDDTWTYNSGDLRGDFDHLIRDNWWCVQNDRLRRHNDYVRYGILNLLPATDDYPSFLTEQERNTTEQERKALVAAGPAQQLLADEAVAWARAMPTDLRAAEALARAIEGGRWSCSVSASSKRAFETLHRVFPDSEWTRRTKYWYAGQ